MKITIFSSNQPRHLNLARCMASIAEDVFFISECNTVFPGQVADFFKKSDVMKQYFGHVLDAEKKIFGEIGFLPSNVSTLSIKNGDLNMLSQAQMAMALQSDIYVVFGASYIKGWLADFLVEQNALNIHMGLSPYYRGTSCNFWALYDNNPSFVGATIHKLSKGLDSGAMLFHCLPKLKQGDSSFDFTMRSVDVAHKGLIKTIQDGTLFEMETVEQNREMEVRYSKNSEFTDSIAAEFLERDTDLQGLTFEYPELIRPVFSDDI